MTTPILSAQNKPLRSAKSPLNLCESAWRDITGIGLRFNEKGRPRHPIVQFTKGVLKLPEDHWPAVVEALVEGRWRAAPMPLAYIRAVAIRKAQHQKWEMSRGNYAGEGKRLLFETEFLPDSQKSGPCWTTMENGVWLDEPSCTPAPAIIQRVTGGMVSESLMASAPEEGDRSGDDNPVPSPSDQRSYRQWWRSELALYHEIDWIEVAHGIDLDADEEALFWAVLSSGDKIEARSRLGWGYARFDRVKKRLKRKRGALKCAINSQA
jgi:hypothetical protein